MSAKELVFIYCRTALLIYDWKKSGSSGQEPTFFLKLTELRRSLVMIRICIHSLYIQGKRHSGGDEIQDLFFSSEMKIPVTIFPCLTMNGYPDWLVGCARSMIIWRTEQEARKYQEDKELDRDASCGLTLAHRPGRSSGLPCPP